MKHQAITTTDAPAAIGPYSQALRAGDFLYTSGQLPLDPATMTISSPDIQDQTRQALENLKALLKAGGSSLEKTVKVTVFLKDLEQFSAMNEIYQKYFGPTPPARSCVEVARLPKDAAIEIEAIALVD
ncbi:2-iminobutanoate/2-iminopropanoate deaminase [Alkalispirochaeta americana]|uniref:2-iminobutanoate/2-iminopropanoate deaminase n=1 Tax=Alkalispirochaeta americana TaxID=159291 RepID=A0A1N6WDV6_9SPIO|nr:RidA family protein [Alkalispirochaeta americana]SIQ88264.1 2-iminobutanoate/2-iminopropanoate deaminase [Alkalispirochaeta americana]